MNENMQLAIQSQDPLLNLSSIDGRYSKKLNILRPQLTEFALIRYRLYVEIKWFIALTKTKLPGFRPLSEATVSFINELFSHFSLQDAKRIKQIEAITNHDVKALEYWIKESFGSAQMLEILNRLPKPDLKIHKPEYAVVKAELGYLLEFVHFACTSEDINNIAYALMLNAAKETFSLKLQELNKIIINLSSKYADFAMLSRTHGQTASPTTVGKEFANTAQRLKYAIDQFQKVKLLAKINGAVGNFNAHVIAYPEFDWPKFAQEFIEQMGLEYNPYTTQIEPHDYMAQLFDATSRINTILIDFSRDIWGYISLGYFKQKLKDGEIGSSTMPHKVNPIDFENAEGNLGVANALLVHFSQKLPISRWQRDLTDSTVLRSVATGLSHAYLSYEALLVGLSKLEVNPARLAQDLAQSWEVLAEAIQTVMRRYHLPNPYEQLKMMTRGKSEVTQEMLYKFITNLTIPDDEKQRLIALTPSTYTGLAANLAKLMYDD
jgi:adenylosuccinate lyase